MLYSAMKTKTNSYSLCYGFIFNLLVALCTVGFVCYLYYRLDSRLVSLERQFWDKQQDGMRISSGNPGFYSQQSGDIEAAWVKNTKKSRKASLKGATILLRKFLNKRKADINAKTLKKAFV